MPTPSTDPPSSRFRPAVDRVRVSRSGSGRQAWRLLARQTHGLVETWCDVDGRPVRTFSTGQLAGLPEVVIIPAMGAPSYVFP